MRLTKADFQLIEPLLLSASQKHELLSLKLSIKDAVYLMLIYGSTKTYSSEESFELTKDILLKKEYTTTRQLSGNKENEGRLLAILGYTLVLKTPEEWKSQPPKTVIFLKSNDGCTLQYKGYARNAAGSITDKDLISPDSDVEPPRNTIAEYISMGTLEPIKGHIFGLLLAREHAGIKPGRLEQLSSFEPVTVYVWLPKNKKGEYVLAHEAAGRGSVGHAALQTKDIYASFWPADYKEQAMIRSEHVMSFFMELTGKKPESDATPATLSTDMAYVFGNSLSYFQRSLADDIIDEEHMPDVAITLFGLDVARINLALSVFKYSSMSERWTFFGKNFFNRFKGGRGQNCSGLTTCLLSAGGMGELINHEFFVQVMRVPVAPDTVAREVNKLAYTVRERSLDIDRLPLPHDSYLPQQFKRIHTPSVKNLNRHKAKWLAEPQQTPRARVPVVISSSYACSSSGTGASSSSYGDGTHCYDDIEPIDGTALTEVSSSSTSSSQSPLPLTTLVPRTAESRVVPVSSSSSRQEGPDSDEVTVLTWKDRIPPDAAPLVVVGAVVVASTYGLWKYGSDNRAETTQIRSTALERHIAYMAEYRCLIDAASATGNHTEAAELEQRFRQYLEEYEIHANTSSCRIA